MGSRSANASSLGEGEEIGRRPPAGLGEEVVEARAGVVVGPDVFGRKPIGLDEGGGGVADVAALGVCTCDVDEEPGLAFGGQSGGVDLVGDVERLPGIAEVDVDGDGMEQDVGGAELGVVVIAVLADALGDASGLGEVRSGGRSVAFAAAKDRPDEVHRAVDRQQLGGRVVLVGGRSGNVDCRGDDVLGLVVAPKADERVGESKVARDDVEGVAGQLGGRDGTVCCHPGCVLFVLAGEGR